MGKSIIVIDNFYSNPNSVRELALESELFDKCDLSENFSGNESIYNFYCDELVNKFQNILGSKIKIDENNNAFGRFRFSQKNDVRKTRVHFDNRDWSAVIYLTDVNCTNAGTVFVEHRETGLIGPPHDLDGLESFGCQTAADFDRRFVLPYTLDSQAWSIHLRVPFKYNRLILFRGKELFHSHTHGFGEIFEDARLTQNFFFNTIGKTQSSSTTFDERFA